MTLARGTAPGRMPVIPGSFAYHRPTSVKEAVGLLAQFGDDGRALAGGHSLIPMMKLRLATPGAPRRSRRHRRAQRRPRRRRRHRHRRHDDPARADRLRASERQDPDPARDLAADRRSAGALRRHDRRQCRQWRSGQRHAGGDDVPRRQLSRHGPGRRTPHRGARLLPGRLLHRARARRGAHRRPHSGTARRPRLRLRKAQAQDRRLCHRRRGRRAHHEPAARSQPARSASPMSPKRRSGPRRRRTSSSAQRSTPRR